MFAGGNLAFLAICGFPAFVEDMKVFHHERLNGHYGVAAFVISNTLASIPFLFLIALLPGTIVYFMAELHSGFGHYAFFILTLFASSTCVESLMMAISSLVGRNYLLGIVLGAGIQVGGHGQVYSPPPVIRAPLLAGPPLHILRCKSFVGSSSLQVLRCRFFISVFSTKSQSQDLDIELKFK